MPCAQTYQEKAMQGLKTSVQANEVVTEAVQRVTEFNRRTLDAIAARLYFYLSLTHEHLGTLSDIRR